MRDLSVTHASVTPKTVHPESILTPPSVDATPTLQDAQVMNFCFALFFMLFTD